MLLLQTQSSEDGTIRGYDDDRYTRIFILIALIGGIIAGFAFNSVLAAVWSASKDLHVISIPGNIGAGKITKVTFITFSDGASISNVNITLSGAASERGVTDADGMLVMAVNATTNGSISVNADKSGYDNASFTIEATPGLDIGTSPGSITSGVATYVTFSVTGMGKPVEGAAVNLSGAGVALDGITNSNGQIIMQVNPPNTGKITVTTRRTGYAEGSTAITSASQQTLGVSSSHSSVTVNVPVYITFTVTAGGSAVNDAIVSLSGAATGSGITNQDGKTVILVTPSSTGTITASASKTGFAGGSMTVTSASTQSLSISSSPASITAGVPTYVMFTVTSGNNAINEAAVAVTGAASGNGVTNQNGQVILLVNSTGSGTITASVSRTGYSGASTTFSATGQPTLSVSASPSNVTNGVATYVTFTVTSGGSAVSGASVSISGGGISTDGMTNSAGQVTLQLNSAGSTAIGVTARKTGYVDGTMTLVH
ncbi:MAG: hypothetical protein OIN66_06585 [Candidatus Methanoperedens sp.]|nr:hypothetical protein [Candidatus Methanoperedens sp.]